MKTLTWFEIAGVALAGVTGAYAVNKYVLVPAKTKAATLVAAQLPAAPVNAAAAGVVREGDLVTLPVGTFEGVDEETSMNSNPVNATRLVNLLTAADKLTILTLDSKIGLPVEFVITKSGLVAPGGSLKGSPVAVGVMTLPKVSQRLPFALPLAGILTLVRDGKNIPIAGATVTPQSLATPLTR